eukprot:TRINITY_DN3688_c3_g1_i1.p1 TRINITY_DN3688_c3_g1~~TRINITY_DN3688_c3_g1_i1.p1  ORF type:complete len:192 (+),score=22.37 TRINITY_DN3688_c3_g1_i1:39-614(+)
MPGKLKGTHQNKTAWVPLKHQEDLKVGEEFIEGSTHNCCEKCVEVIEWRQKYGKYKPLTKPSRCHTCNQRTIRRPYHGICQDCALKRKVCAKCEKPYAVPEGDLIREQKLISLKKEMERLPERFKRSCERKFDKLEPDEAIAGVEQIIARCNAKAAVKKTAHPSGTASAARPPAEGDNETDSDEEIPSDEE